MKQIVVVMLVLAAGSGFPTTAPAFETVSNDVMNVIASSTMGVALATTQDPPPGGYGGGGEKPEGDPPEGEPPDGYGGGTSGGGTGGGEQGGGGTGGGEQDGGGSEDTTVLTGAYKYTNETNTLAGTKLESTT